MSDGRNSILRKWTLVLIERGDETLHIGNFYQVEVVNSDDFDLFGRII